MKTQTDEFVGVKPNWQSLFGLAKQIATEQIPPDGGQSVVLEMLGYGQRLEEQNAQLRADVERWKEIAQR